MSLGILNVGDGDTKISFDPENPLELERSKKIVEELIKRGFAIVVQVGEQNGEPVYQRVKAFDAETCEYIIFGDPPLAEVIADPVPKKRRGRSRRLSAATTPAVAVSRSAGG